MGERKTRAYGWRLGLSRPLAMQTLTRMNVPLCGPQKETSIFTLESIGEDDFEFRYSVYESTIKPCLDKITCLTGEQHLTMIRSDLAGSTTHSAIVVGDARVGVVNIVEGGDVISLEQIEILPGSQGQGIGTALVQSLLERAGEARKVVELRVFVINHDARRLYERLGFRVVSRNEHDILMRYTPTGDQQ